MLTRDLFLSHASDDADVARELRADLEAAGYSCWMAPDDIVGTETWTEQILAAIEATRAMIVLVSASANRSSHVSREVNLALGKRRAVLPIRIEAIAPQGSLEYLLSLVQRVDAFPPPIATHRDRILRRVEATLRAATPTETPVPGGDAGAPPHDEPARDGSRQTAPAGPPGPGSVVAGFTVEAAIGEGGMATVFRARQAEPRRAVALKVIRADNASSDSYRRRFLEEKDTLAALEHPGIVPIYAAGESSGHLYIAMRLVDGADLQARIARDGHLSLGETVRILQPIADAIDYAHASGIVHRDLKPSNILLDRDSRPYLTDFGLGKRMEGGADLSDPGIAIGTLGYMAPEQLVTGEGNPLTPAIDIYALGCIVYACLTGEPAFPGATPEQVMYAKVNEPPPRVVAKRPELPPAVDAVVGRALARQPAERFGSAREMLRDLDAVLTASTGQKTAPVVPMRPSSMGARAIAWARTNTAAAVIATAMTLVSVVTVGAVLAGMMEQENPGSSPATTATPGRTSETAPPASITPAPVAPVPFPTEAETAYLALLPGVVIRDECARWDVDAASDAVAAPAAYEEALAAIRCPAAEAPGLDEEVYTTYYADDASLTRAFDAIATELGIERGTGGCTNPPVNNTWGMPTADATSGRILCTEDDGRFRYAVTHNRLLSMVQFSSPSNQAAQTFWGSWAFELNERELELRDLLPVTATMPDPLQCKRAHGPDTTGAVAALDCPEPGDETNTDGTYVRFTRYPTGQSLDAAYQRIVATEAPNAESGQLGYRCETVFPVNNPWTLSGVEGGKLVCFEGAGGNGVWYVWTHTKKGILARWLAPSAADGWREFAAWVQAAGT